MNEFKYLKYHTVYSCEGDIVKNLGHEACFGYVFNIIRRDHAVTYKIIVYEGVDYCRNTHRSNGCFLTRAEIKNHLSILKSLYPIEYSIEDYDKDGEYPRFAVILKISNAPSTFHKYALTWLRYIYEYPYNVILKDVIRLKKESIFRFESRANLLNLCISCFPEYLRTVHQIPDEGIVSRLSIKDLKKKIKNVRELNKIYKVLRGVRISIPPKIGEFSASDIEYWIEGFEERKEIYIKAYKDNKE